MNKLETLKSLKETIEKSEVTLAKSKYSKLGCNCLIGHLLMIGGASDYQLRVLDDESISPYKWYGIGSIIDKINEGKVQSEDDFVGPILKKLGFDIENEREIELLVYLQNCNDIKNKTKYDVILELENLIKRLESAG